MRKSHSLFLLFFFILPLILVFKSLFLPGPLAWGDAPHFYPNELKELLNFPSAWTERGHLLGGVNQLVWLSPLMFIYGLLGTLFGNDLVIRLMFYFPSLILSATGARHLARHYKLSANGQFFASLVYILNTYFITLIDGGQAGLALAYGIFPWTILHLIKLLDNPRTTTFSKALLSLSLLTLADPRIALIADLFIFISYIRSRNLFLFFVLNAINVALHAYWLVPFLRIVGSAPTAGGSYLQLTSVLNGLTLYQPHWPKNIFGKITYPAIPGALLLLLLTTSLLTARTRKTRTIGILFLLSTLLVNGETLPLGYFYSWLMNNIPGSAAFRDSTKFFFQLTLFAGLLLGSLAEQTKNKLLPGIIYMVILGSIAPALLGQMNFVLSRRSPSPDFEKLNTYLSNETGFGRTAWVPEQPPLATQTINKPATNARELVNLRPLGRLNAGTFDRFNYFHNGKFLDFYRLFGIKHLVLSGDPRAIQLNKEEEKHWEDLSLRIATSAGLIKEDTNTSIGVFRVDETLPHIYGVENVIAVVGSDDIYESVSPIGQPFVFFEDGKLNPKNLDNYDQDSIKILFNNKSELDLTMSFLQEYYYGSPEAKESGWAEHSDYLQYKYELLVKGLNYNDFDYGRGIAFSTMEGEKIRFDFNVAKEGDYIFATRSLNNNSLEWNVRGLSLERGVHTETIISSGKLSLLNVVALIPKEEFIEAEAKAKSLVSKFEVIEKIDLSVVPKQILKVDFSNKSPVKYEIESSVGGRWLIFSDSYHKNWKLRTKNNSIDSLPIYSTINGFYLGGSQEDVEIVFAPQKYFMEGIYVSLTVLSILVISFAIAYSKKKK